MIGNTLNYSDLVHVKKIQAHNMKLYNRLVNIYVNDSKLDNNKNPDYFKYRKNLEKGLEDRRIREYERIAKDNLFIVKKINYEAVKPTSDLAVGVHRKHWKEHTGHLARFEAYKKDRVNAS